MSEASGEWKSGGPDLRAARNKRVERERSELVKAAIVKLDAIGAVRPDAAPIVAVALDVVKAARAEVEVLEDRVAVAEERARLAETLVDGVRESLGALSAENDDLASRLAAREEIAESERVERSERVDVVKTVGAVSELAASVDALADAQRSAQRDTVDLLRAIHQCTIGPTGKSAIQDFTKRGEWRVVDVDGLVVKECGSRAEAVWLVKTLLDEEKSAQAEPEHDAAMPDDGPDSPKRRRKPQPGQEHDGYPPPAPAAVDHGVSRRAKRQPRIL